MDRPRALVIGGSLSGLFVANLLRTIGWDAAVFERTSGDLAGRGAGLGAQPALFAVMRRIGIPFDDSIGVEIRSRICLSHSGDVLCELPQREVSTAWDRIYRALKHALPPDNYRPGMVLERFEQDARSVTAVFADGSHAEGDLLIGADGIHSTVRRQLMPDVTPRYAGYVTWRGVAEERNIPRIIHELVFHHMVFCFPNGEMAFSVPVAGAAETSGVHRRCQFVWLRSADYDIALPQMCTDADGRRHGVSIPPPLIRPDLVAELKATAKALIAPQIAELVAQAASPILSPIYDLVSPQIVFGRVALLGDAAFVARPHVGTGVTKAALDAQALAEALTASNGNLAAGLARYDRERRQFGNWLVSHGRYLGSHVEAQIRSRRRRSNGRLDPRHKIILQELGAGGVINGDPISARFV
jgi:2-polyprenyl-6-methoxyphenol hydroxylase-like FAD-dependent oxidoreductase